VFTIFIAGTNLAEANIGNRCDPLYSEADTIYWNIKSEIPSSALQPNWRAVNRDIAESFETLITSYRDIPIVKTTETAEATVAAHPKAIYIDINYSYAPKTAFTTQLEGDALVVWIKTTRMLKLETGEIAPITRSTRSNIALLKAPEDAASDVGPFSYGLTEPLTRVNCDILKYNTVMMCSDVIAPWRNKVAAQKEPACPISTNDGNQNNNASTNSGGKQ